MPTEELSLDVAIGVTIPARDARGRATRLGPVLDEILSAHNYPPVVERLLAEALTLTALLGSLLKDPQGQMTLQAQTEAGAIDLLVCDYLGGELRGYVRHDPELYRTLFGCEVGLSDHTMGVGVAVAAVALGASVVEKHFTLSRADGGVDSTFSLEPAEMKSLVVETERAWKSLGIVRYGATDAEKKSTFG